MRSACPNEESWLQFLEHEQPAPRELDAHLATCADCRALVGAIASDNPSTAEDAEPTVPRERADTNQPDRVGTVVGGRWRIVALAGAGGMGRVYRARHHNGHEVAIKFLHPALASQHEVVRRFRREGYVANRVGHPAVVKVLDDGDDGGPFLVMELLEGKSCRTRLHEEGPFAPDEALRIVEAAARAVAQAHRAGIVHRDIKPDNLFLTTSGDVRLLDFGLASVRSIAADESMTTDGVTMGTVGYMAPEQARGENARVDARSDVWSLAATCVALMTGRTIHGGRTPAEQLAFAVTKSAPPVRTLVSGLSPVAARVLDRALSFDAEHRQADAGELADDLARARSVGARPARSLPIGIAVGVVSVIAVAFGLLRARDQPSVERAPATSVAPPPVVIEAPVPARVVDDAGTFELRDAAVHASTSSSAIAAARPVVRAPLRASPPSSGSHDGGEGHPVLPSASRDPLVPRF